MDYNKVALEMHETHREGGHRGLVSESPPVTTCHRLHPSVAEPCRKIEENPDDVYKYTFKRATW